MVEADVKVRASTGARGPTSTWTTRRARRRWPASCAIVQDFATWYGSEGRVGARDRRLRGGARGRRRVRGARDGHRRARAQRGGGGRRPRRGAARRHARPRHGERGRARRGASTRSPCCRLRPTARRWWSAASTRCGSRDRRIDLVAVPGASSVTGEVWPLAELAAVARRYGAKLFVDATGLASHRAIDMADAGIDYLALSGDMLYAPFGSAALVACDRALAHARSGARNVVGAVALGAACRTLGEVGMDCVAAPSAACWARLAAGLAGVPGLQSTVLCNDPAVERIGLATFELEGYRPGLLAAILGAEHAIGIGTTASGAVRVSFGVATTAQDVGRAGRRPRRDRARRPALGLRPPRARRVPPGTRRARAARSPPTSRGRQRVGPAAEVVEGRLDEPLVSVTFWPTCAAAAMTFELPARPSLPKPPVPLTST